MKPIALTLLLALHALCSNLGNPEAVLAGLSLDEKIGQMIFVYHSPPHLLSKYNIGGVLVMQNMVEESLKIKTELDKIQKRMKIPLLTGIDQEGGQINRLANIRQFSRTPSAYQLARFDEDRIIRYAYSITDFLLYIGINTNLAPCIDPAFNFDGDTTFMFIRERSHGSNPERITARAGAFLEGMNQRGGISILKHFPGYDTKSNSDLHVSVSEASAPDLENYLIPFRELFPRASGLMMNNIIYRNIDSLPAVLSPSLVRKARDISPDKVIMTDDLWAVSLRSFMRPGQAVTGNDYPDDRFIELIKLAFRAGNDIFLITFPLKVPLIFTALRQESLADSTALKRIDGSVLRILKLKKTYLSN